MDVESHKARIRSKAPPNPKRRARPLTDETQAPMKKSKLLDIMETPEPINKPTTASPSACMSNETPSIKPNDPIKPKDSIDLKNMKEPTTFLLLLAELRQVILSMTYGHHNFLSFRYLSYDPLKGFSFPDHIKQWIEGVKSIDGIADDMDYVSKKWMIEIEKLCNEELEDWLHWRHRGSGKEIRWNTN